MRYTSCMTLEPLTAVSAVDGRYHAGSSALSDYFSEFALIRARVRVECEYLMALAEAGVGMRALTGEEKKALRSFSDISLEDARIVKKLEREGHGNVPATNHDVKAVEYLLKQKMQGTSLEDVSEWTHFALTSEDVNSTAYGLILSSFVEKLLLPSLEGMRATLEKLSRDHASAAMLSRTHGQAASPTTFGKEMRVFESRLKRQMQQLSARAVLVKFGGATGNWNAHMAAVPQIDWLAFAQKFVERLNAGRTIPLELNEATTQIEPHDTYAELFDNARRVNTILIDLSQDIWRYISDGWILQKPKAGEVGSSAMPHKVNPIDFENAEGNFGIANALFEHFSRKLPVSRLQRDLSDSTVLRAIGTAFAHAVIGYSSLIKGFGKISVNAQAMREALAENPEVLAEAIQTVLRKEGIEAGYERLKDLTRGKKLTLADFAAFIDTLPVNANVKKRLKALTPDSYIGLASDLAKG
jgi:adenylosuccinate lyase